MTWRKRYHFLILHTKYWRNHIPTYTIIIYTFIKSWNLKKRRLNFYNFVYTPGDFHNTQNPCHGLPIQPGSPITHSQSLRCHELIILVPFPKTSRSPLSYYRTDPLLSIHELPYYLTLGATFLSIQQFTFKPQSTSLPDSENHNLMSFYFSKVRKQISILSQ